MVEVAGGEGDDGEAVFDELAADGAVAAEAGAAVEGGSVDVDEGVGAVDAEVGDAEDRGVGGEAEGDLLVDDEASALEEAEEFVLKRRADTSVVGVEPGGGIVGVSSLRG